MFKYWAFKAVVFITGINGVIPDRTNMGLISGWA